MHDDRLTEVSSRLNRQGWLYRVRADTRSLDLNLGPTRNIDLERTVRRECRSKMYAAAQHQDDSARKVTSKHHMDPALTRRDPHHALLRQNAYPQTTFSHDLLKIHTLS